MARRAWVLAALLLVWGLATWPAWADEGRIAGQVTNGTTGQPVEGASVQLHTFREMEEQEPKAALTGTDGHFEFAVPVEEGTAYWVTTAYQGVTYTSDLLRLPADQPQISATLTVYETTEDPAAIEIERGHLIVDFAPGELRVAELYVMSNLGQETFVGDEAGRTLQFSLPAGATDVQVNETPPEGRFRVEGESVWDTAPLPPGTSVAQHVVSYRLPYDPTSGLSLTREYAYPVAKINLLVPDVGVEVACDDLAFGGTMGQEQVFLIWRGESLPTGQAWTVRFQGEAASPAPAMPAQPSAPATSSTVSPLAWGGALALFVAVLAPLLYVAMRRRPASASLEAHGPWLDALARLDADHQAGTVDEATYREKRAAIKAELMARLGGGPRPEGQRER